MATYYILRSSQWHSIHVWVVGCCGFSFLAPKTKISTSCAEKWIQFAMFLSIFRCSGRILIGPRCRMYQPICRQAIYQVSALLPYSIPRSRRRFITSWSAEFVDEKWPKLVAKNACAWFFARLVESFSLRISSCALFSHRRDALHQAFSYATEVFDAGESNGRCTKMWFQREHVETASETPRYLSFFVDLTPLRPELAFGAPTIQKSMLF